MMVVKPTALLLLKIVVPAVATVLSLAATG